MYKHSMPTPHWWKHGSRLMYFHRICLLGQPPPAYTHSALALLPSEWHISSSAVSYFMSSSHAMNRAKANHDSSNWPPPRYIYSTVTNMRHRRWRGNWLSPLFLFCPSRSMWLFFHCGLPKKREYKLCTIWPLRHWLVTYWVHKLEGLKIRSDIWDRKDRKRKQSGEAAVCWEGWPAACKHEKEHGELVCES